MSDTRAVPWALSGIALALGCGGPAEPQSATGGAAACQQRLTTQTLSAASLPELREPTSHLTVNVTSSRARLARLLESRIPRQLAAEKNRDAGFAGRVTYRVRRGDLSVGVRDGRLTVQTPIQAEVAVCKNIGPFCPTYGRCQPRFSATASLPLQLGPRYNFGKSDVRLKTVRGCILQPIGLNVTDHVQRMAQRQTAGVQRRIDSSLPSIRDDVQLGWQLAQLPLPLDATTCLRMRPTQLTQGAAQQTPKTVSTRLALIGTARIEDPCTTDEPPLTPLTAPSFTPDLPERFQIRVPVLLSWSDASAKFSASTIDGSAGLVALETAGHSRKRVRLRATLSGRACGDVWLTAKPYFDMKQGGLRLKAVAVAPGSDLAEAKAEALVKHIERTAHAAVPINLEGAPAALQRLVTKLGESVPGFVQPRLEMASPGVGSVQITTAGLVPVAVLSGRATVAIEEKVNHSVASAG